MPVPLEALLKERVMTKYLIAQRDIERGRERGGGGGGGDRDR